MKGSVNNNKKTKHRCMFVKEIAHFLLCRKPSAFLFDIKKKSIQDTRNEFPIWAMFLVLVFYSIEFKFIIAPSGSSCSVKILNLLWHSWRANPKYLGLGHILMFSRVPFCTEFLVDYFWKTEASELLKLYISN